MGVLKRAAMLGAFAACACGTTTGTGHGMLVSAPSVGAERGEAKPVEFAWSLNKSDVNKGTITATLRDGSVYRGELQRMYTRKEGIAQSPYFGEPAYEYNWQNRILSDPGWEPNYQVRLEEQNSNSVMAMLRSDVGARMNCLLHLDKPDQGMRGGARGDCQLSNGEAIHDVVLAEQ